VLSVEPVELSQYFFRHLIRSIQSSFLIRQPLSDEGVDRISQSFSLSFANQSLSSRASCMLLRATDIHQVSGNWKTGFQGQRSKVKVICVQVCECYNGGGIHFDGVVSRLTCFFVFSHKHTNMNVFNSSLLFFRCFRVKMCGNELFLSPFPSHSHRFISIPIPTHSHSNTALLFPLLPALDYLKAEKYLYCVVNSKQNTCMKLQQKHR